MNLNDPTGELTAVPQSLAGFQGLLRGRPRERRKFRKGGRGGKEKRGKEGEEGDPHFFLKQFNHCLLAMLSNTIHCKLMTLSVLRFQ